MESSKSFKRNFCAFSILNFIISLNICSKTVLISEFLHLKILSFLPLIGFRDMPILIYFQFQLDNLEN